MPTTTTEYYALLEQQSFCQRVEQYVSSLACSDFPASPTLCPCCNSDSLGPLEMEKRAFEKPGRGADRPATAQCSECGEIFGGSELVEAEIARVAKRDNISPCRLNDASIHYRIAMPQSLELSPDPDPIRALVVSKALLAFQTHRWSHSKSCFKPTKRTPKGKICRMFFPKHICDRTECAQIGTLQFRRRVGSEYLNTYVPMVNSVLKTNHDINFLSAGEGKNLYLFYLTDT